MRSLNGRGFLLIAAFMVLAIAAVSCGSSSVPTATLTPAPTAPATEAPTQVLAATEEPAPTGEPFDPSAVQLTQTHVFEGFGFSIDFPDGWVAETEGDTTFFFEASEDRGGTGPPRGFPPEGPPGFGVIMARAPIAAIRAAGLPEAASLDDLLELNSMMNNWQRQDVSEVAIFGVPALAARIRLPDSSDIAVMGFRNDEGFLLTLKTPNDEERDLFLPVWQRMLDSIKPVAMAALSDEGRYFKEVRDAISLTAAKLQAFGAVFSQTFATRDRLIDVLLEAGVGTAFVPSSEELEKIEPPRRFASDHRALVETYRTLVRIDQEAELAVKEGDLAGFVLANGRLGEATSALRLFLSAEACRSLFGGPPGDLCAPTEPLPGGEYGSLLHEVLRTSQPERDGVTGTIGFSMLLNDEETAAVISDVAPKAGRVLGELRAQVAALTPPPGLSADHDRLIEYFDRLLEIFDEVTSAAEAGDSSGALAVGAGIEKASEEALTSFESRDFHILVAVHFPG